MYKVFVVLAVLVAVASASDSRYTTKYDNVNLDEILKSKRLIKAYSDCLLDLGPCNQEASELKKIGPEALQEDCAKCSERQREGAKKVLIFIYKNEKEIFDKLEAKYDPKKQFRSRYREEAEKEGIPI